MRGVFVLGCALMMKCADQKSADPHAATPARPDVSSFDGSRVDEPPVPVADVRVADASAPTAAIEHGDWPGRREAPTRAEVMLAVRRAYPSLLSCWDPRSQPVMFWMNFVFEHGGSVRSFAISRAPLPDAEMQFSGPPETPLETVTPAEEDCARAHFARVRVPRFRNASFSVAYIYVVPARP